MIYKKDINSGVLFIKSTPCAKDYCTWKSSVQWSNYKGVYRSSRTERMKQQIERKRKEKKSTIHPGQMNHNHRVEFKKVPVTP